MKDQQIPSLSKTCLPESFLSSFVSSVTLFPDSVNKQTSNQSGILGRHMLLPSCLETGRQFSFVFGSI